MFSSAHSIFGKPQSTSVQPPERTNYIPQPQLQPQPFQPNPNYNTTMASNPHGRGGMERRGFGIRPNNNKFDPSYRDSAINMSANMISDETQMNIGNNPPQAFHRANKMQQQRNTPNHLKGIWSVNPTQNNVSSPTPTVNNHSLISSSPFVGTEVHQHFKPKQSYKQSMQDIDEIPKEYPRNPSMYLGSAKGQFGNNRNNRFHRESQEEQYIDLTSESFPNPEHTKEKILAPKPKIPRKSVDNLIKLNHDSIKKAVPPKSERKAFSKAPDAKKKVVLRTVKESHEENWDETEHAKPHTKRSKKALKSNVKSEEEPSEEDYNSDEKDPNKRLNHDLEVDQTENQEKIKISSDKIKSLMIKKLKAIETKEETILSSDKPKASIAKVNSQNFSSNSGPISALLKSKCSQKEIQRREEQNNLTVFELDKSRSYFDRQTGRYVLRANPEACVKAYVRSAADLKLDNPEDIRTEATLAITIKYLLDEIVDSDDNLDKFFHYEDCTNTFSEIAKFVEDRFRSVRQDITILALKGTLADLKCNIIIARFLILCLNQCLCFESFTGTQALYKLFKDQLNKTLSSLRESLDVYICVNSEKLQQDLINSAPRDTTVNITFDEIVEVYTYSVFLNMDQSIDSISILNRIPSFLRQHPKLRFATRVYRYLLAKDFVRFFRAVQDEADYLESCILSLYFHQMRVSCLKLLSINEDRKQIALKPKITYLRDTFLFDGEDQLYDFLVWFGIDDENIGEEVYLIKLNDTKDAENLRKYVNISVENKKVSSSRREICLGDINIENLIEYIKSGQLDITKAADATSFNVLKKKESVPKSKPIELTQLVKNASDNKSYVKPEIASIPKVVEKPKEENSTNKFIGTDFKNDLFGLSSEISSSSKPSEKGSIFGGAFQSVLKAPEITEPPKISLFKETPKPFTLTAPQFKSEATLSDIAEVKTPIIHNINPIISKLPEFNEAKADKLFEERIAPNVQKKLGQQYLKILRYSYFIKQYHNKKLQRHFSRRAKLLKSAFFYQVKDLYDYKIYCEQLVQHCLSTPYNYRDAELDRTRADLMTIMHNPHKASILYSIHDIASSLILQSSASNSAKQYQVLQRLLGLSNDYKFSARNSISFICDKAMLAKSRLLDGLLTNYSYIEGLYIYQTEDLISIKYKTELDYGMSDRDSIMGSLEYFFEFKFFLIDQASDNNTLSEYIYENYLDIITFQKIYLLLDLSNTPVIEQILIILDIIPLNGRSLYLIYSNPQAKSSVLAHIKQKYPVQTQIEFYLDSDQTYTYETAKPTSTIIQNNRLFYNFFLDNSNDYSLAKDYSAISLVDVTNYLLKIFEINCRFKSLNYKLFEPTLSEVCMVKIRNKFWLNFLTQLHQGIVALKLIVEILNRMDEINSDYHNYILCCGFADSKDCIFSHLHNNMKQFVTKISRIKIISIFKEIIKMKGFNFEEFMQFPCYSTFFEIMINKICKQFVQFAERCINQIQVNSSIYHTNFENQSIYTELQEVSTVDIDTNLDHSMVDYSKENRELNENLSRISFLLISSKENQISKYKNGGKSVTNCLLEYFVEGMKITNECFLSYNKGFFAMTCLNDVYKSGEDLSESTEIDLLTYDFVLPPQHLIKSVDEKSNQLFNEMLKIFHSLEFKNYMEVIPRTLNELKCEMKIEKSFQLVPTVISNPTKNFEENQFLKKKRVLGIQNAEDRVKEMNNLDEGIFKLRSASLFDQIQQLNQLNSIKR